MAERFISSARIAIPGVVRASGANAAGFEELGRVAQDQFNKQLEQESISSFDEGARAGVARDESGNLTAAFTGDSDTLSKSYDDGVASTYLSSLLQDSSMFIAEKRREFAEDPDGFQNAVSIYGKQQATKVPERLRADFMVNFEQDFGNNYNSLADGAAQRALNNAKDTAKIEAARRISMMAESISKYSSPTDLMMSSFRRFLDGTGAAMTDDERNTFLRAALVSTTEQKALNALLLTQEPGAKAGIYDHTTVKALTDAIRSGGDTSAFDNLDVSDLTFDEREVIAQTVDQKVGRDRAEEALNRADQRQIRAAEQAETTALEKLHEENGRVLNDKTTIVLEGIEVSIEQGNQNIAYKSLTDQLNVIQAAYAAGEIGNKQFFAQREKLNKKLDQIITATNDETEALDKIILQMNNRAWAPAPTAENYTAFFARVVGGTKALNSDQPEVVDAAIATLSRAASTFADVPPQVEFMFANAQTLTDNETIALGRLWDHLKRGDSGNAFLPNVSPEMEQFWDRQADAYKNGAGRDPSVLEVNRQDLAALTLDQKPPNRDQLFQAFAVEDENALWEAVGNIGDVASQIPGNGYLESIGQAFANASNTFSGIAAMWGAAWRGGQQIPVELEDQIKANYLYRAGAYAPNKDSQLQALDYAVQSALQAGEWGITNLGGAVRVMKHAPEITSPSSVMNDAHVPQDLWQTRALYDQLAEQGATNLVWRDFKKEFAFASSRTKNRLLRFDRIDPETGRHVYRYWSAAGDGPMYDVGIDIVFDENESSFVQEIRDIAEINQGIGSLVFRKFATHMDIYHAARNVQQENEVINKGYFERWGDEVEEWALGKQIDESWGEYVLRSAPSQAVEQALMQGNAAGQIMGEVLKFSGIISR